MDRRLRSTVPVARAKRGKKTCVDTIRRESEKNPRFSSLFLRCDFAYCFSMPMCVFSKSFQEVLLRFATKILHMANSNGFEPVGCTESESKCLGGWFVDWLLRLVRFFFVLFWFGLTWFDLVVWFGCLFSFCWLVGWLGVGLFSFLVVWLVGALALAGFVLSCFVLCYFVSFSFVSFVASLELDEWPGNNTYRKIVISEAPIINLTFWTRLTQATHP